MTTKTKTMMMMLFQRVRLWWVSRDRSWLSGIAANHLLSRVNDALQSPCPWRRQQQHYRTVMEELRMDSTMAALT